METILGVKVYKISDVLAALAPMRHVSEAPDADQRYYSYGGIKGLLARKYPAMRPIPHGVYLPVERVNEAVAALNQRPRAAPLTWKEGIPPILLCGIPVVNMELFADGVGRSLSNIRKEFYKDDSVIHDLFIPWDGGFALTQAEYKELMAWIPKFGDGPRPTKFRKNPQKRRGARLNYEKIVVAKAVTPDMEEGDPVAGAIWNALDETYHLDYYSKQPQTPAALPTEPTLESAAPPFVAVETLPLLPDMPDKFRATIALVAPFITQDDGAGNWHWMYPIDQECQAILLAAGFKVEVSTGRVYGPCESAYRLPNRPVHHFPKITYSQSSTRPAPAAQPSHQGDRG